MSKKVNGFLVMKLDYVKGGSRVQSFRTPGCWRNARRKSRAAK